MNETKKFACSQCCRGYNYYRNLRQHVFKAHPEKIDDIAPVLRSQQFYAYQCKICSKNFNYEYNYKRHQRDYHGEELFRQKKNLKCVLCNQQMRTENNLFEHLEVVHKTPIKVEELQFPSFDDFRSWKQDTEEVTRSLYIQSRGSYTASENIRRHYFVCHRTGDFVSKSAGIRKLKKQGSNKICGVCPAKITVRQMKEGVCKVKFVSTHVGHKFELNRLRLSGKGKAKIASNIANEDTHEFEVDREDCGVASEKEEIVVRISKRDSSKNSVPCGKANLATDIADENTTEFVVDWENNISEDDEILGHVIKRESSNNSVPLGKANLAADIANEDTNTFVVDWKDIGAVSEKKEVLAEVNKREIPNNSVSLAQQKEMIASEVLDLIKGISTTRELGVLKKCIRTLKASLTAVQKDEKKKSKTTEISKKKTTAPQRLQFSTKTKKIPHPVCLTKPDGTETQILVVSLLQKKEPAVNVTEDDKIL